MINDLFANLPPSPEQPESGALDRLLRAQPRLRRGADFTTGRTGVAGLASGHPRLDALLPWQGWPEKGLIEIIQQHPGMGELQLLMPLLRHFSRQEKPIMLITPPHTLYAPALLQADIDPRHILLIRPQDQCQQALWSAEKALQSRECALVMLWQNWLSSRVVRRLQLAASTGGTLGFLFHRRPVVNSPATLQIRVESAVSDPEGSRALAMDVLRARGSHCQGKVKVDLHG